MYNREAYISADSPIKNDLLKLFKKDQKLVILDIGGCEGEESIRYLRIFPNSSIFCFEPLPGNQKIILENIRKYNVKNIYLVPVALSDEEGNQQFYVSSGHPDEQSLKNDWDYGNKSSSLLHPDKHLEITPWVKFENIIEVPTSTLKIFLSEKNIPEVDFIHLDVQGAELKVLYGAGSLLKKIKAIWMEVSDITLYKNQPVRAEVEKFMKENGFYLYKNAIEGYSGDQMYINQIYFN